MGSTNTIAINLALMAETLKLRLEQVAAVVDLLDAGNTVPFITRYRKDQTGGLDEEQIRQIQARLTKLRLLSERKQTILRSIESQGKLTPELAAEIEAARLLTYRAAWMADRGEFTREYVPFLSMAKYYATELAVKVSNEALQMLGAAGYMKDHMTELYYRDAKQLTIVEGTSQIQLGLIAGGVLRGDLWWD